MNARYLLGIGIAAAALVAACGDAGDGSVLGGGKTRGAGNDTSDPDTDTTNTPPPPPGEGTTPSGSVPTSSEAGKADFEANVFPFLNTKCSGCHNAGGLGTPSFMKSGDAVGTYSLIYTNGFAVDNSRIIVKGAHSGGAAPALDAAEKTKWMNWLAKEQSSSTKPTQQNVLEKFGTCFDQAKFDAIGFQQLRTTRRQNGNNPQNLNENANNCTGCDNTQCYECHSGGARSTGFIMAYGAGAAYPANYTFEQTKLLSPPFIRQFIATDATGAPVYNPGVKNKSTNTVEKAKAYTHPMYRLTPAMEQGIQAFVDDAIAKYKAGTCGK